MDSTSENDDFYAFLSETNEYDKFFGCIKELGLDEESELSFEGDVELMKKYEEKNSATLFTDSYDEKNDDDAVNFDDMTGLAEEPHQKDQSEREDLGTVEVTSSENKLPATTLTNLKPPTITSFQLRREPRSKYLLRFPKLFQEFMNSGNLHNLKILFDDVLSSDVMILTQVNPPVVGRDKVFASQCSMLRNVPDCYVVFSKVTRPKRQLMTMASNNFGTFPYANTNDPTRKSWNLFEFTPEEKLDEHHKIQKQKYDTLKSQNKDIKIERRVTWYLLLSADYRCITKIMTNNMKYYVY